MADDGDADDLGDDLGGSSGGKKGGLKGVVPGLLKWILIGVGAVILIVTIVVITTLILNKGGKKQTFIPVSEEYTTQREDYDWYTSLDQIRTSTSDAMPASVSVTIALGYKKDDKAASAEITSRRIEIIDFLRRFFSEKTVEELKPQNEEVLKQQIRDQINDDILSNARIRAVMFTAKDVVQQ
ncbi:MAG: flagellar basal body-associated FliL family protein [Treponema sp.]|nr:flagellar basal body-associated FliL family protein [Treponema sp.]